MSIYLQERFIPLAMEYWLSDISVMDVTIRYMKFHGTFPISNSLYVVFINYTYPKNSNIFITKLYGQIVSS